MYGCILFNDKVLGMSVVEGGGTREDVAARKVGFVLYGHLRRFASLVLRHKEADEKRISSPVPLQRIAERAREGIVAFGALAINNKVPVCKYNLHVLACRTYSYFLNCGPFTCRNDLVIERTIQQQCKTRVKRSCCCPWKDTCVKATLEIWSGSS